MLSIDYRGLHRDVCDMRNRAERYLAEIYFGLRPRTRPADISRARLQQFEQECREFIEEIYPKGNA